MQSLKAAINGCMVVAMVSRPYTSGDLRWRVGSVSSVGALHSENRGAFDCEARSQVKKASAGGGDRGGC